MESYLFVPANQNKYLSKINSLTADYFIFDLEDSVSKEEREQAVQNIVDVPSHPNIILRIFWDKDSKHYSPDKLIQLFFEKNFKNFLVPKITDGSQLKYLTKNVSGWEDDIQWNILVENPSCLVHLREILAIYDIERVFFGSYDYCSELKIRHVEKNYEWPKNYMLHVAKGFGLKAIDVAHLNLKDEKGFLEGSKRAFQAGFDGKVIIHPRQLQLFGNEVLYEEEDLNIALHLKKILEGEGEVPAVIHYKGRYLEKTHLGFFNKVLKMAGYEEIYNG